MFIFEDINKQPSQSKEKPKRDVTSFALVSLSLSPHTILSFTFYWPEREVSVKENRIYREREIDREPSSDGALFISPLAPQ